MKKGLKRILVSAISFCLILTCALIYKVKAAVTTTSLLTVEGAQVRTEGFAGIRFVGSSTYDGAVQSYGIAVALGEVDASEIVLDASGVYSATVNELDTDGKYYLTIYNVPEAAYASKITARAYVVLEDTEEVVYAETATSKSLAEVSIAAKAEGTEGEIITTVIDYVAANYKNVWTDAKNNVHVASPIYETVPANLEQEFLKDWNEKFGTSLTDVTITDFYDLGATGFSANTDTDPSLGNYFKFFRDTENGYEAKWLWLLEYFASVDNTVHVSRQANAI